MNEDVATSVKMPRIDIWCSIKKEFIDLIRRKP